MRTPTLYTVDASIYVFRGWFTLPDSLTDTVGNPINAVIGFVDFLTQLVNEHRPLHLVCAFDESLTSSWRNDLYPEYKANRESAPEELKFQFQLCRELVAASGLREFASPVLEADDIIATLASNARAAGAARGRRMVGFREEQPPERRRRGEKVRCETGTGR